MAQSNDCFSPCGNFKKMSDILGEGSYKIVYKCFDNLSGDTLAWAELKTNRKDAKSFEYFANEASILRELSHPNILAFKSHWDLSINNQRNMVLVTEMLTGGTIKGYLQRNGHVRVHQIMHWCASILDGLKYLHSRSPIIIHRDIKCDNVFIGGIEGGVKIGDFGLATRKTSKYIRGVSGSTCFMAKEIYEGKYDESVDIHAFGMAVFEMSTGRFPYQECSSKKEIDARIMNGIKPEGIDAIPHEGLCAVINMCIGKQNERPTAEALSQMGFFNTFAAYDYIIPF